MIKDIYIKGAKFDEVERAIKAAFAEVDAGKYDEVLVEAGVKRPRGVVLSESVIVTRSQGASTDEWMKLAVELAPLAVTIGGTIWKIAVVPKLKRLFHDDRVQEHDPKKKGQKKRR